MRRFLFLIVFAAASARPGHAQSPDAESESHEDMLIRSGVQLRQAQKDEEALQVFLRAWNLSGSGRALAQVALAEQALGRWLDAEAHLGQALARAGEPWIAQNRKLLAEALYDIEGHLGWLELRGGAKRGRVGINGKTVATLPMREPLRVPAGSVAVQVEAEGYLPILRVVVVPSRGLAREPLAFVAAAVAAPVSPARGGGSEATGARGWGSRQIAGAALGTAAVAALSVGIAFHVIRQDRANSYKGLGCDSAAPSAPFDDCRSRYDAIGRATTVAIAGYVSTALLSGAAAYLLLGGRPAPPAATSSATLRCDLWLVGGVLCGGRF